MNTHPQNLFVHNSNLGLEIQQVTIPRSRSSDCSGKPSRASDSTFTRSLNLKQRGQTHYTTGMGGEAYFFTVGAGRGGARPKIYGAGKGSKSAGEGITLLISTD